MPKEAKQKKPSKTHSELTDRRVAFVGEFSIWPGYHHANPSTVAKRHGAILTEAVDDTLDVLVLGDNRGEGRAETKKKAEKLVAGGAKLKIVDEATYREWVRIDLTGKRFVLVGGFDCSPDEATDRLLARMVENVGGVVVDDFLGDHQKGGGAVDVDYVVRGLRKGEKKMARLNLAEKLIKGGSELKILEEGQFLALVRKDAPLGAASSSSTAGAAPGEGAVGHDFSAFMGQLYGVAEQAKIGRALKMLKAESFKLFNKVDEVRLIGVVKSQTGSGEVYAPWLNATGQYGCCTQDLDECMGLQGAVCKHLLVLVVGLTRTGVMPAERGLGWLKLARKKGPKFEQDLCAETLLQYKGAEAGTVDWRPTETLPEDFLAL